MTERQPKILIIRFSSFGDVLQTLSVVGALQLRWPQAQIHWVTRSEFSPLIENHHNLKKAWALDKKEGIKGLFSLCAQLHLESFDLVYDAHNNLRSHFLCTYLFLRGLISKKFHSPVILRRSIHRWKRFLLFRLRINKFEQPFSGQRDLLEPLKAWGISNQSPPAPQLFLSNETFINLNKKTSFIPTPYVALAPSAAFELKRWPLSHWKSLLQMWFVFNKKINFVLLGGPDDLFLEELAQIQPQRVFNLAGQLSLTESTAMIKQSVLLIANDTGLLHAGEQLGHPTIALMGPAPFGFPSRRSSTRIMELSLSCRPCSKHGQGPCRNAHYQWCLVGITPEMVFEAAKQKLDQMTQEQKILHE